MLSSRRKSTNRSRSRNRKDSDPEELPLSITRLTGATKLVRRVIFVAERNLVVATSYDNSVRVYNVDTPGEPCAIFRHHDREVYDVVQLEDDLVASVGDDKFLFTWKVTRAELVGEWEHDGNLMAVAKLDESKRLFWVMKMATLRC